MPISYKSSTTAILAHFAADCLLDVRSYKGSTPECMQSRYITTITHSLSSGVVLWEQVHAQLVDISPKPPWSVASLEAGCAKGNFNSQICLNFGWSFSCDRVTGHQGPPWPPPIQPMIQSAGVQFRQTPYPFLDLCTALDLEKALSIQLMKLYLDDRRLFHPGVEKSLLVAMQILEEVQCSVSYSLNQFPFQKVVIGDTGYCHLIIQGSSIAIEDWESFQVASAGIASKWVTQNMKHSVTWLFSPLHSINDGRTLLLMINWQWRPIITMGQKCSLVPQIGESVCIVNSVHGLFKCYSNEVELLIFCRSGCQAVALSWSSGLQLCLEVICCTSYFLRHSGNKFTWFSYDPGGKLHYSESRCCLWVSGISISFAYLPIDYIPGYCTLRRLHVLSQFLLSLQWPNLMDSDVGVNSSLQIQIHGDSVHAHILCRFTLEWESCLVVVRSEMNERAQLAFQCPLCAAGLMFERRIGKHSFVLWPSFISSVEFVQLRQTWPTQIPSEFMYNTQLLVYPMATCIFHRGNKRMDQISDVLMWLANEQVYSTPEKEGHDLELGIGQRELVELFQWIVHPSRSALYVHIWLKFRNWLLYVLCFSYMMHQCADIRPSWPHFSCYADSGREPKRSQSIVLFVPTTRVQIILTGWFIQSKRVLLQFYDGGVLSYSRSKSLKIVLQQLQLTIGIKFSTTIREHQIFWDPVGSQGLDRNATAEDDRNLHINDVKVVHITWCLHLLLDCYGTLQITDAYYIVISIHIFRKRTMFVWSEPIILPPIIAWENIHRDSTSIGIIGPLHKQSNLSSPTTLLAQLIDLYNTLYLVKKYFFFAGIHMSLGQSTSPTRVWLAWSAAGQMRYHNYSMLVFSVFGINGYKVHATLSAKDTTRHNYVSILIWLTIWILQYYSHALEDP